MAEKSEKATPKKLRDARKKGQVAKSQDFPAAFTFATSLLLLVYFGGWLYDKIGAYLINTFYIATRVDVPDFIGGFLQNLLYLILDMSLPIAGLTAAIGVLVNFIIVGPLFASKAMVPDLKKLNPITGLRNKFKMRTLVELIKSLLKITIAAVLIYTAVWGLLGNVIATAAMPPIGAAYIVSDFLQRVAIRVGIFFLAIAIFDLAYQKRVFSRDMKMEKFEVKQEHKDLEGDPQIKSRRRQMAQEIAYEEGPIATRRARVVVTNPTHIAVSVGYDPEQWAAPFILTMGIGPIADAIIAVAVKYDVPIMRDVALARMLYERGTINRFIPEEAYEAMAEALRWVISLEES